MDTSAPRLSGSHLIILVHGIRTRALWMGVIKPVLEKNGFSVAATSYGRYGLFKFLLPFNFSRQAAVNRVVTDVVTAQRIYKPDRISVIAHSFGTYIVARILSEHPEIHWHKIIFCGSVVREDYPIYQYLDRFDPPILNEIGTKDYLPALAESVGWGYGSVGSTGFNRPPVETRWHKGFRHSDFLQAEFCRQQWIPFLEKEIVVDGDEPQEMPLWIRSIVAMPLRLIPPLLAIAITALVTIFIHLPFRGDPNKAPASMLPLSFDSIISTKEIERLNSFLFPNRDNGHPTRWIRFADKSEDYWIEKYIDGSQKKYLVKWRINKDDCDGTVVYLEADKESQIFIPDLNNLCSNHFLFSRITNFGDWKNEGYLMRK